MPKGKRGEMAEVDKIAKSGKNESRTAISVPHKMSHKTGTRMHLMKLLGGRPHSNRKTQHIIDMQNSLHRMWRGQ